MPEPTIEATAEPLIDETNAVDLDMLINRISERASELRGLDSPPSEEVVYSVINQERLDEIIEQELSEADSQEDFRLTEPIYKLLGLMPKEDSLDDVYKFALSMGVAGLYDPDTKEFLILQSDTELDSSHESTFAHEYQHFLQDYHFDLVNLQEQAEEYSDSSRAVVFLAEGDAEFFSSMYTEAGTLLDDPTTNPLEDEQDIEEILSQIPLVVLLEISAPYAIGQQFVLTVFSMAGYEEVDNAFRNPPESTEQIIHAEKYFSDERYAEVRLDTTILGEGWTVQSNDRLGEFFLLLWGQSLCGIECVQRSFIAILSGGDGWNGDNALLLQNDAGEWALAGLVAWDSPERDSLEFYDALQDIMNASDVFTSIDSTDSNQAFWEGHSGVFGMQRFEHSEHGFVVGYVVTPSEELTREALESMARG